MVRRLIALALSLGLTTPAFAGGIRESGTAAVQRAAAQQAARDPVTASRHIPKGAFWAGGILFAAGMALASYGFLHTSDGDYVEPVNASTLANTKAGIGGLGIAAAGGAIMLMGAKHGTSASALRISKRVSW